MSRLNPPPFIGGPLRPGISKWEELEIAALQTGGPSDFVSNSAKPVDKSVEPLPAPADISFSLPVKPVRESNGENGEWTQ